MENKIIKKPEKKTISFYHYNDIIDYIERKYNIDTRDYYNRYKNFPIVTKDVCERLGVNSEDLEEDLSKAEKDDLEVKRKLDARRKVNECRAQIMDAKYPYCDFWHQYCDKISGNGSWLYLTFDCLFDNEEDSGEEVPKWQKEILQLIYNEFKEELEDNEYLKVWVEW